ncbi:MAG: hypothetical protein AAFY26_08775 [Cyanobacteria bacterium J06638_22]
MTPAIDSQRQDRYMKLIDRLLTCSSGEEPAVLDSEPDLLDAGFVQLLVHTSAHFAHHNNHDAAKFLAFTAKELARQLGLYPQVQEEEG